MCSSYLLATGSSLLIVYKELIANGTRIDTHIVSAIASVQGIDFLQKHLPNKKCTLWVGAIDQELTAKSYIVPGLGDAGDLSYGSKTQE